MMFIMFAYHICVMRRMLSLYYQSNKIRLYLSKSNVSYDCYIY